MSPCVLKWHFTEGSDRNHAKKPESRNPTECRNGYFIDTQYSRVIPYPTAFPYGNGMVLHFYQQQESSTTKTVHKVINKGLKAYV